jgi:hypothetical protein
VVFKEWVAEGFHYYLKIPFTEDFYYYMKIPGMDEFH